MRLERETSTRLQDIFQAAAPTDEIEARYTGPVTYDRFDALVRYFRAHGREFTEQEAVDVSVQLDGRAYRASAAGAAGVAAVMDAVASRAPLAQAHRAGLTCILKSSEDSVTLAKHELKITRKSEVPVTSRATLTHIADRIGSNARLIRAKRRFSCLSDDGACRYDLTAVNHVPWLHQQGQQQQQQAQVRYEVEVEVLPHAMGDAMAGVLALLRSCTVVLKLLLGADYLVDVDERQAVLAAVNSLTRAGGRFVGPKPVTLELRHLADAAPGRVSVKSGYTITDKADGERALLYVDAGGRAFLVDDRMTPRLTGLTVGLSNTLLDAEVIVPGTAGDSGGRGRRIIACFDAYVYDGKDIRGLPLALGVASNNTNAGGEDRLTYLRRATGMTWTKTRPSDPDVMAKEFRVVQYGGEDLHNQVKYLIRKRAAGEVPYATDGFIFTPARMAVGAANEGAPPPSVPGGRWDQALKWKPPEFNSIDFLVRFTGDLVVRKDEAGEDVLYRAVQLHVGTKASAKPLGLLEYARLLHRPPPPGSESPRGGGGDKGAYVTRLFEAGNTNTLHLAYLRVSSEGGVARCENGDVINDETIVEMTYACVGLEQHRPECWRPLRVRGDKTERYHLTNKNVSGTANDINTALSVWRSICFPVTLDMLTGAERVPEKDLAAALSAASSGLYYIRSRPREQSASLPMIVFHNHWVKRESLINKFKGRALSLLDLGCGRGGDIDKWADAGFLRVLGIDPVDDNLTNPGPLNEGACMRALSKRQRAMKEQGQHLNQNQNHTKNFPKIVFLRMDASRVIGRDYIEALHETDPEARTLARAVWALDDVVTLPPELRALHGFASQGFDLVTCMFAAHYFFDSLQRLRNFAANVANQLRTGGHFVMTCLDGGRVMEKLSGKARGESVEGRKDGRLLWSLTKLYDDGGAADAAQEPSSAQQEGGAGAKRKPRKAAVAHPQEEQDLQPGQLAREPAARINKRRGPQAPQLSEDDPRIARKVAVFVETIGQPLDEYLVDYSLLRDIFAEKGIVPVPGAECARLGLAGGAPSGFFDDLYRDMTLAPASSSSVQVALQMSDAEKEYSFMHRWYAFVKR